MPSDLSVIIVTFNVREMTIDCLQSLYAAQPEGVSMEVLVVDNASSDDTVQAVQARFPDLKWILNSSNKGFAAANNQALRMASGEFILLLNPDTVVKPGAIEILLDFMRKNGKVAVCGPRLVKANGKPQHSVLPFPSALENLLRCTGLDRLIYAHKRDAFYWRNQPFTADYLTGACLMLRRAAIEGEFLFDERFFMYAEEMDLCLRLHRRGWQVYFVPAAEVIHFGGQSAQSIPVDSFIMKQRSLILFFHKHYSFARATLLSLTWGMSLSATWLAFAALRPFSRDEHGRMVAGNRASLFKAATQWYWSHWLSVT